MPPLRRPLFGSGSIFGPAQTGLGFIFGNAGNRNRPRDDRGNARTHFTPKSLGALTGFRQTRTPLQGRSLFGPTHRPAQTGGGIGRLIGFGAREGQTQSRPQAARARKPDLIGSLLEMLGVKKKPQEPQQ